MITLLKYNNRKVYNRQTHRYVSLKEIAELVKKATPFKVIEYNTEKDITEKVIAASHYYLIK